MSKSTISVLILFSLVFISCPDKTDIEAINLNFNTIYLNVNQSINLVAAILPADAVHPEVAWSSDNPEVAIVDDGFVTGLSPGTVTISVKAVANPAISASCIVHVVNISISITPTSLTIGTEDTVQLVADVSPETVPQDLLWFSSAPSVVSVDENGTLVAHAIGTATISASSVANPGSSAQCNVTVEKCELGRNQSKIGQNAYRTNRWYYFYAAVGSSYNVSWLEAGSGYSAEIEVTIYKADKTTVIEGPVDASSISFYSDYCEKVYVKVSRNGTDGSFLLNYNLSNTTAPNTWTMILYFNGDNLEDSLMDNVREIAAGYHSEIGINILLLLDKPSENDYGVAGCNFSGTRLFTVGVNALHRINGNIDFTDIKTETEIDFNMGDPAVLRQLINTGKNNYPAAHYALITHSHGEGPAGMSGDATAGGDRLHVGEISDELDSSLSVDVIGFNACLMGSAEIAYQIREGDENTGFSARYMLASAGKINVVGWKFDTFLQRINSVSGGDRSLTRVDNGTPYNLLGGNELIYDPALMTADDLCTVIIEEQWDGMESYLGGAFKNYDCLTAYRLDMVGEVKTAVDILAKELAEHGEKTIFEQLRDNEDLSNRYYWVNAGDEIATNRERIEFPLFELRSLSEGIEVSSGIFHADTVTAAQAVTAAVDNMLLYSYYFTDFSGDYGLSIFCSMGDLIFEEKQMFEYQYWYNPAVLIPGPGSASKEQFYGNLAWCADGATKNNATVENWFELMDFWYDDGVASGGWNEYQY